jgi:phosphonate transport system permease protein
LSLRDSTARDPAYHQRLLWVGLGLIVLWPLLVLAEFKPWVLLDPNNLKPTWQFLKGFFIPKLDGEFLWMVAQDAWRTVAIATAGMTLAWLIAAPLSLLAVRTLSVSSLSGRMDALPTLLRWAARWVMVGLRSVPELIWALVFVRVVGLGPTAGVIAIALTYGGMLGKVYADILDSGDAHATHSLLRNGSGRLEAFFYGLLPQNAAELTSYTVYRWECAIRSSAVLGFVGAGGLGQQMDASMKMFNGNEVSTMLLVFMILVWLADVVSSWLRKALA